MPSLEYSDLWKIKLLLTGKAMERKTYFNSLEPEKKNYVKLCYAHRKGQSLSHTVHIYFDTAQLNLSFDALLFITLVMRLMLTGLS